MAGSKAYLHLGVETLGSFSGCWSWTRNGTSSAGSSTKSGLQSSRSSSASRQPPGTLLRASLGNGRILKLTPTPSCIVVVDRYQDILLLLYFCAQGTNWRCIFFRSILGPYGSLSKLVRFKCPNYVLLWRFRCSSCTNHKTACFIIIFFAFFIYYFLLNYILLRQSKREERLLRGSKNHCLGPSPRRGPGGSYQSEVQRRAQLERATSEYPSDGGAELEILPGAWPHPGGKPPQIINSPAHY